MAADKKDSTDLPKQAAQIQLTFHFEPPVNYSDTDGTFQFFQTRLDAAIPIYTFADKHHINHSFGVNVGLRYTSPVISLFTLQHDVYTVNPGINYTIYQPDKFSIVNTIGTGFADDNYTIDNYNVRFLVSSVYDNVSRDKFKYRLGLVMAYYGNNKYYFTPLIGANIKFNQQWRLYLSYPFNSRLTYKFSNEFQTYFSFKRRSETFRLSSYNESLTGINTASLQMQKIDFPFGIGIKKTFQSRFILTVEGGVMLRRNIALLNRYEEENVLFRVKQPVPIDLAIERGPYIEVGCRYLFGKIKKDGSKNQASRIIQLLDINDSDLEDMIEHQ